LVRRALSGQRFDKVFAVNINLFWVRLADAELQLIKDLLRPGGVVHLVYETPGEEQASRVANSLRRGSDATPSASPRTGSGNPEQEGA
jgi:hypothetical protein